MATAAHIEVREFQELASDLTPEFALLCACCRSAGTNLLAGNFLHESLDWDRVFKQAVHHRVLPAIWATLSIQSEVPASVLSALRARFMAHAQRALRFSAVLVEILRESEHCGIEVLPHKGPALSQVLYGDSAMREFGDLDFLIRACDVGKARHVLRELGYECQLQLSPRQEKEYLRSGYEYVFGAGEEKSLIELQWQILARFYAIDFEIDALFRRSVELIIEGCRTRTLCHEDLLLALCVHAAKHEWMQLGMLRDIATLGSRNLDWACIRSEAKRLGIMRILLVSLLLAHDLLACALPECFIESPELPIARKLAAVFRLQLALCDIRDVESFRYFRSMLQFRERWQDRVGFVWRLASTPSVSEWKAVKIPDALFPLYRGVRGARLIRRAVSCLA
jgi:hypothetical protein